MLQKPTTDSPSSKKNIRSIKIVNDDDFADVCHALAGRGELLTAAWAARDAFREAGENGPAAALAILEKIDPLKTLKYAVIPDMETAITNDIARQAAAAKKDVKKFRTKEVEKATRVLLERFNGKERPVYEKFSKLVQDLKLMPKPVAAKKSAPDDEGSGKGLEAAVVVQDKPGTLDNASMPNVQRDRVQLLSQEQLVVGIKVIITDKEGNERVVKVCRSPAVSGSTALFDEANEKTYVKPTQQLLAAGKLGRVYVQVEDAVEIKKQEVKDDEGSDLMISSDSRIRSSSATVIQIDTGRFGALISAIKNAQFPSFPYEEISSADRSAFRNNDFHTSYEIFERLAPRFSTISALRKADLQRQRAATVARKSSMSTDEFNKEIGKLNRCDSLVQAADRLFSQVIEPLRTYSSINPRPPKTGLPQ